MESFFLAETTKYLYLLFDPDNFIHNDGRHGKVWNTAGGRECIIDAGGYVFNTGKNKYIRLLLHFSIFLLVCFKLKNFKFYYNSEYYLFKLNNNNNLFELLLFKFNYCSMITTHFDNYNTYYTSTSCTIYAA